MSKEVADSKTLEVDSQNLLVEVNLGTQFEERVTYVSAKLSKNEQTCMIELLKEYVDCFAWNYNELPGLEKSLVEYKLPIKPGFKPVKQQPRRMTPEVTLKVKEEVKRLLKAGFIRTARFNVRGGFYRMSRSYAAIVGGSLAFLAIIIGLVWFCMSKCKTISNKNSETGSSDPSAIVELKRGGGPSSSSTGPTLSGPHGTRQFPMEELEQATKNFDESNLIGYGSFGLVYKGILSDGTFVAIKRRSSVPRQELVQEVAYLSGIWHRHLVTLLGYCQERGYQMLVFENLPNSSICNHLYDLGTKLEFKQRLSIALGAAKGLCHLHSQTPPIIHSNFKTANVLVDENFIAKVADAGVSKLLRRINDAGPSHMTSVNVFQDPEVDQTGIITEASDVYSFGVFLLELITGREASQFDSLGSNESVLRWVETQLSSNEFVERGPVGSFTDEGMKDFIRLMLQCMSFPGNKRPTMKMVELEIDRILEKEITLTTLMGEGTATFTLGSQLFTQE